MNRDTLVRYLDDFLAIDAIDDASKNGLQVEGAAQVARVAFAVDACLQTIRAAARGRADMLVVHHGLFWSHHVQVTGVMRRRLGALIEAGMSLYAAHLPLDGHAEVGNNVELARLLRLEVVAPFGDYHGFKIGCVGRADKAVARSTFARRVEAALESPARVLEFGPARVRTIGIVSGAAAQFAPAARDAGCDTLLTGESSHTAYHLAREARINLVYAGHYASETVGVKALAAHLRGKFDLACKFVHVPTGY